MSLFVELKRRNVFRVAAAYTVVSWLLMQVVDTLGPLFELSNAFGRGVFLLLLIGLPVVLVVAWVFEFTDEGIKTQEEADQSGLKNSSNKLNAVVIGGLALALVFVVLDAYVLTEPGEVDDVVASNDSSQANQAIIDDDITVTSDTSTEKSIAVLPFTNLSPDTDQAYFADGLTEELIATLSVVNGLQVTGKTSSFFFKGSDENPEQIADSLGVNHILQGSVRKAGNQVRITTTLMNAVSGFNLWTNTFERDLEDIFAIQDQIAREVTNALSITLGAGEFDRPGMTRNIAAYDAYLNALGIAYGEGFQPQLAIDTLNQAVELDPEFGLAWLELAKVYQGSLITMPASQTGDFQLLRAQVLERATAVSPDMAELRILTASEQADNRELLQADSLFQQLLEEYSLTDAQVNSSYANFLREAGRSSDAIPYLERARRLDPYNTQIAMGLVIAYANLGQYDAALDEVDRGLALDSTSTSGVLSGMKTMIAWNTDNTERDGGERKFLIGLGLSAEIIRQIDDIDKLILEGDQAQASARLREMIAGELPPILLALLMPMAGLAGDPALALEITLMADTYGETGAIFGSIPIWQEFLSEMRQLDGFKELTREAGLVDYWRATGEWGDFCRPLEGSDDFECF